MRTLIIPCAGKSSRFPNMKPKWMLTHPDGKLMIEKALGGLDIDSFDRIIITIVKYHAEKYEADVILSQVFKDVPKVELCILDDFTSSASETIYSTINEMDIKGSFVVKDSDNNVGVELPDNISNSIVGYDLYKHPDVSNIPSKSFLIVNKQGIIDDIIEKRVVSNIICLGVYLFEDAEIFKYAYEDLLSKNISGELYVSHIISYILSKKNKSFLYIEANDYEDWGTISEWEQVQNQYRTYFCDIDGVLLKNCGKYGKKNWYNNEEIIPENMQTIKNLQDGGAQIVITTSRPEELRAPLEKILNENGIYPYAIIMGLNHAARVVINDFAPTNPYPSCIAISFPRNAGLVEYIK